MICRKQNFTEYFKKYGFYFLRLILRKVLYGDYKLEDNDEKIVNYLKVWAGQGKM